MSPLGRRLDAVAGEGARRFALRGGILLGSCVMGAAMALASPHPIVPALVVLGVIAISAVLLPDSPVVLVLLLMISATWVIVVPRPERAADLVLPLLAALGALAVHLCAAAWSVWPPGTVVPRLGRLRWWRRSGVVALAVVSATALAGALIRAAPSGHRLLSLLAITGVCTAALAGYRWSGPRNGPEGGAQ